MEFYVDNKIVGSIDYSNNEEYKRCFNRPQYIQMNLATGGNWAEMLEIILQGKNMKLIMFIMVKMLNKKQILRNTMKMQSKSMVNMM